MRSIKEKPKLLFAILLAAVLLISGLGSAFALTYQEPQAFAVYDENTNTLTFHKQTNAPDEGTTFVGSDGVERTATEVYTGIETTEYEYGSVPWSSNSSDITSVAFLDKGIKPISTAYWFQYFTDCNEINIEKLDTSQVTNMNNMFCGCVSLTQLDVSSFDTSKVTDMKSMFMNFGSFTTLDLSNFDTNQVTNMDNMFMSSRINSLDLSSFDTSNVTNMSEMFTDTRAHTIYVSDRWCMDNVSSSSSMFMDAYNLTGGNGMKYSFSNPDDGTYAHIDTPETPGYFTYKEYMAPSNLSEEDPENPTNPVVETIKTTDVTINDEAIEADLNLDLLADEEVVSEAISELKTVTFKSAPIKLNSVYTVEEEGSDTPLVTFSMTEEIYDSIQDGSLTIGEVIAEASGDTAGSKITVETEATSINVTVPTNAAFIFKSDGSNVYPSNYAITNNNGLTAITLDGIDFTGVNGWKLTTDDDTFQADQKKFALSLGQRGNILSKVLNDTVSFTGENLIKIQPEDSKVLDFEAVRGVFSEPVSTENAMEMLMHFNWEQAA